MSEDLRRLIGRVQDPELRRELLRVAERRGQIPSCSPEPQRSPVPSLEECRPSGVGARIRRYFESVVGAGGHDWENIGRRQRCRRCGVWWSCAQGTHFFRSYAHEAQEWIWVCREDLCQARYVLDLATYTGMVFPCACEDGGPCGESNKDPYPRTL